MASGNVRTSNIASTAGSGLELQLKNEQGEDLLGPVKEEEDLVLMREARMYNAVVSKAVPVDDRGQGDEEDEEDEEDELLLDIMDDIDDEAMYAAMRRQVPEEEDRPGNFGGFKPGFLKDTTSTARPPAPVVIGDVCERQTQLAGTLLPAAGREAEKAVHKKPESRFKMSLNR